VGTIAEGFAETGTYAGWVFVSKGDTPRPLSVTKITWDGEYDRIFYNIDQHKIEQRVIDRLTKKEKNDREK
jgi:hypothetical protein